MKMTAVNVDITTLEVDTIVNAANSAMVVGGGVDGAIHAAAGPELIACNQEFQPYGCPTGQVRRTSAYNLPSNWIFHTVGPDMREYDQELGNLLLDSCYRNCMKRAIAEKVPSIAFPSISTGVYGFDKELAAAIAVGVVSAFRDHDIEVTFACFGDEDTAIVERAIAVGKLTDNNPV